MPHGLLRRSVRRWSATRQAPLVACIQSWELDHAQPKIASLSRLDSIRQYRNLGKTAAVLEEYLQAYAFRSIRDHLGLAPVPVPAPAPPPGAAEPQPLSIVVPLFCEEENVAYLRRTLDGLRVTLGPKYRLHLVLIDDCSTDTTWQKLQQHFGDQLDCTMYRHDQNKGVAAAILTGIDLAPTETVCSMDCDCSYDPGDLAQMVPLLENAEMVTASPYHPAGRVCNVPKWRLFLSRNLSRLYNVLLGERIHTYTSCFRVYRRQAVRGLRLQHGDFLGVAELLLRLRQSGGRVVEYPTRLECRLFGESKMKVLRTIRGHIGLMWEMARSPARNGSAAP
jgi:glycosyltransferase involved in cell wall biosynthesis